MKKEEIFVRWYDITGWILDRAEKFPRSQRFVFGQRITNLAIDILEGIIRALYSHEKMEILKGLNVRLETMRVLIRLAKDRRLLSLKAYEYASKEINQVGSMLGGWIRQQERR